MTGTKCAMSDLLRLLGKTHVLSILWIFHNEGGPRRFVDIQRKLAISPNTLSERLKELVDAGLLTRTAYNEIPPRVDYEGTAKLDALKRTFDSLAQWTDKHDLAPTSTAKA